jgi:hypothetical protein
MSTREKRGIKDLQNRRRASCVFGDEEAVRRTAETVVCGTLKKGGEFSLRNGE